MVLPLIYILEHISMNLFPTVVFVKPLRSINLFLQALERLSFGGSRISDTIIAQGRILMFWYWNTYLLLQKNKPKYQQLQPPAAQEQEQLNERWMLSTLRKVCISRRVYFNSHWMHLWHVHYTKSIRKRMYAQLYCKEPRFKTFT